MSLTRRLRARMGTSAGWGSIATTCSARNLPKKTEWFPMLAPTSTQTPPSGPWMPRCSRSSSSKNVLAALISRAIKSAGSKTSRSMVTGCCRLSSVCQDGVYSNRTVCPSRPSSLAGSAVMPSATRRAPGTGPGARRPSGPRRSGAGRALERRADRVPTRVAPAWPVRPPSRRRSR